MILNTPATTMQPRAACQDCKWSIGSSSAAIERAAQHAIVRNHRVMVVTEQVQFLSPEMAQVMQSVGTGQEADA